MNSTPSMLRLDHAVDGVAAAAAHADHLDARAARDLVVKVNAHFSGLLNGLFHGGLLSWLESWLPR